MYFYQIDVAFVFLIHVSSMIRLLLVNSNRYGNIFCIEQSHIKCLFDSNVFIFRIAEKIRDRITGQKSNTRNSIVSKSEEKKKKRNTIEQFEGEEEYIVGERLAASKHICTCTMSQTVCNLRTI